MIERLKKLYEKPFVQVAVKSAVVALAESIVKPWGYSIVETKNIEKTVTQTETNLEAE